MGEQPVACAPKNRTGLASTQPSRDQFPEGLGDFSDERASSHGTTTLSGNVQPNCSAIS